jgi:hypothetical protein
MGNAAKAGGGQEKHLGPPAIRTERPAVAEHHRLACAPVLEINLRTVFRRNRSHCLLPFLLAGILGFIFLIISSTSFAPLA